MKATRKEASFVPVVLSLESQVEIDLIYGLLGATHFRAVKAITKQDYDPAYQMYKALQEFSSIKTSSVVITVKG